MTSPPASAPADAVANFLHRITGCQTVAYNRNVMRNTAQNLLKNFKEYADKTVCIMYC
jgi:hypothetical protein